MTMKISDELRQLSATINYLNEKQSELLLDLRANPENTAAHTVSGRNLKHRTTRFTR